MRTPSRKVTTWAASLLGGVIIGVGMGIYSKVDGGSTGFAAVAGVVSGLFFILVMIVVLRRVDYLTTQALRDTPAPVRRAALRALRRGPVPADPEVRLAAIRLAEHQLVQLRRWRTWALIIWGLELAINVLLLVSGSPWRLLLVAIFLFLFLYQFYRPKYLRARIEVLESGLPERVEEDRS